MKVVITRQVLKRCPHKPEIDRGQLTVTFAGPAMELHALAAWVESLSAERISHEEYTRLIAEHTAADVSTTWTTAGWDVCCTSAE